MKRSLSVLIVFLTLPWTGAQQNFYLGLRADGVVGLASSPPVVPFLGFQVGGVVADRLELRLSASTVLLVSVLQADVLYTRGVSDTLRAYGGVGGDVAGAAFGDAVSYFFVHATAGLEYRSGVGPGLFAEVQPLYGLSGNPNTGDGAPGLVLGKLTLGVNVYP